jgi:hypothetical protein
MTSMEISLLSLVKLQQNAWEVRRGFRWTINASLCAMNIGGKILHLCRQINTLVPAELTVISLTIPPT